MCVVNQGLTERFKNNGWENIFYARGFSNP
jgi:hypothetical protein